MVCTLCANVCVCERERERESLCVYMYIKYTNICVDFFNMVDGLGGSEVDRDPQSTKELKKRLKKRAEDSDEIVEKRMAKAQSEISHWIEYDYVLVNENIDICLNQIFIIIRAERLKRFRQNNIFDFVEKLS